MFVPLITRPSVVSRAAPTRNFEYGEYENALAGSIFSFGSYGRQHRTQATFETGSNEELLLFGGHGCSSHLIFSRLIVDHSSQDIFPSPGVRRLPSVSTSIILQK